MSSRARTVEAVVGSAAPQQPLVPPLKYAGGKRWLVSRLHAIYEKHRHRRLVEPFVGGMSVTLGLQPERALLADANPHLITFWRRLCDPKPFYIPMHNTEADYYQARTDFNTMISTADNRFSPLVGELVYYLNRTCFNGLIRFNRHGKFNVPYGKYKAVDYKRDFSEYATVLKKWSIRYCSFEHLKVEPEDFVYLDPPFDQSFTDYVAGGFEWEKQVQLAEMYAEHQGPVVASNLATDRILKLYHRLGYNVTLTEAPRHISCDGNRAKAKELLAFRNINYKAPDALEGQTAIVEVVQ